MNSVETRSSEKAPVSLRFRIAAIAVFLAAGLHLVWLVCDYSRCFQNNEVYGNWAERILLNGKAFSLSDFSTALDSWALDGDSRPRFLSYLFAIWTEKTRLALWDAMPPHPSWSPVWLFSLLIAPWLFFHFLKGELGCRWGALLGTGLYMATSGYLSSASMLFHPGKPLASVTAIWALFLAMKADRRIRAGFPGDDTPRLPVSMKVFLIFAMPILLFADETAVFALLIPLAWNPEYFLPRRWNWKNLRALFGNLACMAVPPVVFLLFVFVVAPRLCSSFYDQPFDFISYLSRSQNGGKLNLGHVLQHATTLLTAGLAPWPILRTEMPVATTPVGRGILPVVYLLAGIWLTYRIRRGKTYWKSFAKAVVLAMSYVVFQTFVDSHHPFNLVATGYYYGAIFSVLLAVMLGIALGDIFRSAKRFWLAAGMAGYLMGVQVYNFSCLNRSWMEHDHFMSMSWFTRFPYNPFWAYIDASEIDKLYGNSPQGMYAPEIPEAKRRSGRETAVELWRRREWGYRDYLGTFPLPLADLWLLAEFYYWRTPDALSSPRCSTAREDRLSRLYRAALARAQYGEADEEPIPVLAFRQLPGCEPGGRGFDTKLGYPWIMPDVQSGVERGHAIGYTHWISPVWSTREGQGSFWAFHRDFASAVKDRRMYTACKLIDVGHMDIDGQELEIWRSSTAP